MNHHHQHGYNNNINNINNGINVMPQNPADMTVIVQRVNLFDGPAATRQNLKHEQALLDANYGLENSGDGLADFFDEPSMSSRNNNDHQANDHSSNQTRLSEPPPPVSFFYYIKPPPVRFFDEKVGSANAHILGSVKVYQKEQHISARCYDSNTPKNFYMDQSTPNPNPAVIHDKYWAQRRRLFSRFDQGIQLDGEGWFSVTPEIIAEYVAEQFCMLIPGILRMRQNIIGHLHLPAGQMHTAGMPSQRPQGQGIISSLVQNTQPSVPPGVVILDAFCGCGGNSIAFAKLGPHIPISLVVCVDLDRNKLRMAARNALIYGIPPQKIVFIQCDTLHVVANCYQNGKLVIHKRDASQGPSTLFERCDGYLIGGVELLPDVIDVIFMDPPWGGISYESVGEDGYDLVKDMRIQYGGGRYGEAQVEEGKALDERGYANGADLLRLAAAATSSHIVIYDIPRNTNKISLGQAALAAGYRGNIRLDEHYLNNRLKTATAYLGCDHCHIISPMSLH